MRGDSVARIVISGSLELELGLQGAVNCDRVVDAVAPDAQRVAFIDFGGVQVSSVGGGPVRIYSGSNLTELAWSPAK